MTSDLINRVWEHKNGVVPGFTKNYNVHQLAYYEMQDTMDVAIQREKQLKKWNRIWKIKLIEESNPEWADIYHGLF